MATPRLPDPYAAPSRRAIAFGLDFIALQLLFIAAAIAWESAGIRPPGYVPAAIVAAYLGLLPATPLQGTFGKRLAGIRIADLSGKRIGLGRSLLRLVLFVPSIGLAGMGFVAAAFTRRRQALHDLGAGTLVVRLDATPEALAPDPPPMWWFNRLGLALVVGFVSLVLYMFVQVYQDRRMREHTMALVANVRPYQEEVARALDSQSPMPVANKLPRHARAMAARPDGAIVVEVADELLPGARFVFRPVKNAKGEVMWTCRAENARPTHLPAWCRP